jgi:hypothetical protein
MDHGPVNPKHTCPDVVLATLFLQMMVTKERKPFSKAYKVKASKIDKHARDTRCDDIIMSSTQGLCC